MKITKTTKIITSIASFLIGGILMSKLSSAIYQNQREFPVDHNKLFDGIEVLPIMALAFLAGGLVFVFLCHFILKKVSKRT